MVVYTPQGMQLVLDTLEKMNARGFFLNPKMGSRSFPGSCRGKGGYTTANYIWDLFQSRKINNPSLPAVEAYHEGLKQREIPADDDPRFLMVHLRLRFGGRRYA